MFKKLNIFAKFLPMQKFANTFRLGLKLKKKKTNRVFRMKSTCVSFHIYKVSCHIYNVVL
jgi:hypothetical protein